MHKFIRKIKRFFHNREFIYGWVYVDEKKKTRCRLNKKNKKLEFVLWRARQQGHNKNYWHEMGDGWATKFKRDKK